MRLRDAAMRGRALRAVMLRECGASSIPEPSEINRDTAAYWIARIRGR
jgi:hypothetical protein